jgi:SAM-dependent methyltransferase
MIEPTQRFSACVQDYVKYRPRYPDEAIRILQQECGLVPEWRVADVGSGTGFLAELFLRNGNPTFGVEPNDPMREAAETLLKDYPHFTSVDGSAENTTLPGSSLEMIAAGQAFHWFDRRASKREFGRILRPGGWVVLIWNERRVDTPFLRAYERLLTEFAPDYEKVDHRHITQNVIAGFFAPSDFQARMCENLQTFDFDGLKGRLLSCSYAPKPGEPGYEPMIEGLGRIFDQHHQDGRIVFEYDTKLYFGRLDE